MWRYVLKRLAQAVPTVVGVVLITFVLFNVVGGSPAAMVLGQNAGARSLEEFDDARGYNKPLFFGRWTATRALEAVDFSDAPPSVRAQCVSPTAKLSAFRLPFPCRKGKPGG
jgi:peptide/nickel transport system permease protein